VPPKLQAGDPSQLVSESAAKGAATVLRVKNNSNLYEELDLADSDGFCTGKCRHSLAALYLSLSIIVSITYEDSAAK